jgi:homogentisate 1,2-dioxygenase
MADRESIPVTGGQGPRSRQTASAHSEAAFERELAKEGSSAPAAVFHHRHPPTAWSRVEGSFRPRAFLLTALAVDQTMPWSAHDILANAHLAIRFWRPSGPMRHLARNADGDDLLFVHQGAGELFCDYGHLTFGPGDYIYLPRGTMWRLAAAGDVAILMIEATGGRLTLPGPGDPPPRAVAAASALETPVMDAAFRAQQTTEGEVEVHVKRGDAISRFIYPFNPLDAVDWRGEVAPARLNVSAVGAGRDPHDRPILAVYTTFVGERFIVRTQVPPPPTPEGAGAPRAVFRTEDDYDCVVFHHADRASGPAKSRAGMATWRPSGFTQPPLDPPGETAGEPGDGPYAVMIAARDSLVVAESAASVEVMDYHRRWEIPRFAQPLGGRDRSGL